MSQTAEVVGSGAPPLTLSLTGVSKRFGSTQANADITFDVELGSIHSIIGQNGAGKSTLMKLVFGLERPDTGTIKLRGVDLRVNGPRDALRAGIGFVAQELALIEQLSALENLVLGNEPTRGPLLDLGEALKRAQAIEKQLGLAIDWQAKVSTLSIAEKQQIEILRLLLVGADILILDEPTAVLAPPQVTALLDLLRKLRSEGKTIIFISHKLREVMAISDRISVLRAGKHLATFAGGEKSIDEISELIIGAAVAKSEARHGELGPAVLFVERLSHADAHRVQRLRDVDATFRSRAITGVCGVAGNGQREFMSALAGLLATESGCIRLGLDEISEASVRERREAGIAYIAADRKGEGLAPIASVTENAIAGFHWALSRFGWFKRDAVRQHTSQLLERFDVVHSDVNAPVSSLSGGNQQKLMVGREILHEPKVLLAAEPTRGVDLGGIRKIHEFLVHARDTGAAVILASEDLDELMDLSDEILVFYGGRITATFERPFDRAAIGNAMIGLAHHAA